MLVYPEAVEEEGNGSRSRLALKLLLFFLPPMHRTVQFLHKEYHRLKYPEYLRNPYC